MDAKPKPAIRFKNSSLFQLPNDIVDSKNALPELIANDANLTQLYRDDAFILQINDEYIPLKSQILKSKRSFYTVLDSDQIIIHVDRHIFTANCREQLRNTLYLQMLTDRQVSYGDEQRVKQAHLFTHQLWVDYLTDSHLNQLQQLPPSLNHVNTTRHTPNVSHANHDSTHGLHNKHYLMADITGLIGLYKAHYLPNQCLNLFFTTQCLRDYHYQKHKQNAFYHIQAINLPFQNIEFYYAALTQ